MKLGMHGMIYSSHAEELRAFIRDVLGFTFTDVGDGWLIFNVPEADLGVHPTASTDSAPNGMMTLSLYTDDIKSAVSELRSRGVEFTTDIEDHGFGFVTFFAAPGDITIQLYEPKYEKHRHPSG